MINQSIAFLEIQSIFFSNPPAAVQIDSDNPVDYVIYCTQN